MTELWWAVALAGSFITAVYVYINQVQKLDSSMLMVYRGIGLTILFLPFIFFFSPPTSWQFYALCIAQGFIVAFNDYRYFRSAKAFGAEVTSSIQPLSVGLVFIFWLLLKPAQLSEFLSQPLKSTLIVLCLIGVSYSILKVKRTKSSKKALYYLIPFLILLGVNDVINKQSMSYANGNLPSVIYYYCIITSFVGGILNLKNYNKKYKLKDLLVPKHLISGILVIFVVSLLIFAKNISMYLTPNPAYVTSIILLAPLWVLLGNNIYNKVKGNKTGYASVDIKLLLVLLASIIGLVLLNR